MAQQAPHTVLEAMIACGIDHVHLYQGSTAAQRYATEVFGNEFDTCLITSKEDLKDIFKDYADRRANIGRIALTPLQKNRVIAFTQWTRDKFRCGQNPALNPFPVERSNVYIKRLKDLETFKAKVKTIAETAKPSKFESKSEWNDWKPIFTNFLRHIPGNSEIPLSYVIRDEEEPVENEAEELDYLDNLIAMAPLNGAAYDVDKSEVHTYLIKFVEGNATAESKIRSHNNQGNGRSDYMALRDHYQGVGIHAIDKTKAERVIDKLFYNGEKHQMNWEKFEKELNLSWAIIDRHEGRAVYSDEMKRSKLMKKIESVSWLLPIKASLEAQMLMPDHQVTYQRCMTAFRNAVSAKFPPELIQNSRNSRRVQETKRNGKGKKGGGKRKPHQDERMVKTTDGRWIAVHASYRIDSKDYNKLPASEKKRLNEERAA